jgi:hypothetical protein
VRLADPEVRGRVDQVDTLLARVQALPPGEARSAAVDLLEALLDLYGEGLARIVATGGDLAGRLAEDELVAHLLLLHGLHPADSHTRVQAAVERVRAQHADAGIELVSMDGGTATVRVSSGGCSATAAREAVRNAITDAAPELSVELAAPEPAVIPVDSLFQRDGVA